MVELHLAVEDIDVDLGQDLPGLRAVQLDRLAIQQQGAGYLPFEGSKTPAQEITESVARVEGERLVQGLLSLRGLFVLEQQQGLASPRLGAVGMLGDHGF